MIPAKPCVIVLNGIGSAGKTSTALALQRIAARVFLRVGMDEFFAMWPQRLFDHPDGLVFHTTTRDGVRSIDIRSGSEATRLLRGMRRAISVLAAEGYDLVVDDVMFSPDDADDYHRLLVEADLRLVGLFAPLPVLESRERARGDREIGLARGQHGLVHRGMRYDLELDTAALTPDQCAEAICTAFDLQTLSRPDVAHVEATPTCT